MNDNQHVVDEGLHDCARGERCAARKSVLGDDGRYITVPAQTYRAFCDADVTRIRRCLDDLPHRYVELSTHIGDKTTSARPRVSGGGKAAPPIPINTGVEALQQQITEIVTSWEERVRDAARLADVSGARRTAHAVASACATLSAHVHVLLALPADALYRTCDIAHAENVPDQDDAFVHDGGWIHYVDNLSGVEAGVEILNLHHRCLARLGWTPQHHDLRTACWDCEIPRLRRWDGTVGLDDHVTCRNCGSEYLGDRLQRLMVEEEMLTRKRQTRRAS
jgi:hypothetical protein